jgi:hypothetical protein
MGKMDFATPSRTAKALVHSIVFSRTQRRVLVLSTLASKGFIRDQYYLRPFSLSFDFETC